MVAESYARIKHILSGQFLHLVDGIATIISYSEFLFMQFNRRTIYSKQRKQWFTRDYQTI